MFHFSLLRYVEVCLCVLVCLLASLALGEINHPQKIGIGTWEDSSDEGDLQRLESVKFSCAPAHPGLDLRRFGALD